MCSRFRLSLGLFLAGVALGGCAPEPDIFEAPKNFRYSEPDAIYTVGVEITPNRPTNDGGPIQFYGTYKTLPTGLTMNNKTGEITGTPAFAQGRTRYTVYGDNADASGSTAVQITILRSPLSPLPLDRTPVVRATDL